MTNQELRNRLDHFERVGMEMLYRAVKLEQKAEKVLNDDFGFFDNDVKEALRMQQEARLLREYHAKLFG